MRLIPVLATLLIALPAAAQQAPGDSARVYELHQVEVRPRPQNVTDFTAALQATYPPHLRDAGVGGTARASFVVGADGRVGDVRVLSASDSAFGTAALQALPVLRFSPAEARGRPVAVRVEQPILWSAVTQEDTAAPEKSAALDAADAVRRPAVYEITAVTEVPRPVSTTAFQQALARGYPTALRDAGQSGRVMVRFIVDEEGRVQEPSVIRTSDRAFDAPTLHAVRQLRFRPAKLNGQPVRVRVEMPIDWHVGPSRGVIHRP